MKFKNDRYRKNRGGYSRWLLLSCEKCDQHLAIYQKDGSGVIKRIYIDRIVKKPGFLFREDKILCKHCNEYLGVLYVYEKENRLAYRLFVGAIGKKIISANKL